MEAIEVAPIIEPTKWYQRKGLKQIGIAPMSRPMVASVVAGSAAEKAGFKPNDVLTRVGGDPIYEDRTISDWAKAHPDQPIVITVERGSKKRGRHLCRQWISHSTRAGSVVGKVFRWQPRRGRGFERERPHHRQRMASPRRSRDSFVDYIWEHEGKEVELTIERGTETKKLKVTPELPSRGHGQAEAQHRHHAIKAQRRPCHLISAGAPGRSIRIPASSSARRPARFSRR